MSTRSAGRLPTHELTARRHRKQTVTKLPALLPYRAPATASGFTSAPRTNVPGNILAPYIRPQIKLRHKYTSLTQANQRH